MLGSRGVISILLCISLFVVHNKVQVCFNVLVIARRPRYSLSTRNIRFTAILNSPVWRLVTSFLFSCDTIKKKKNEYKDCTRLHYYGQIIQFVSFLFLKRVSGHES